MADVSAKTLKTLEKHPSCSSLICNIYECDKLLLDCFENFYNSKKRVITIYRLLKGKMGFCSTELYFVSLLSFFTAQACLGDHCTSFTVCGWWYSICLHSLVLKALTTKKTHGTFFSSERSCWSFWCNLFTEAKPSSLDCSFPREEEGSRLICPIEDASYFLSVEQMPSVTSVWVEKHKRFWIWACECFLPCEKSYYSQLLFHLP